MLLLLPGTFMNESGRAVAEAAHFYKLGLSDIVVFHDEIDLPPGKVRVKTGGGDRRPQRAALDLARMSATTIAACASASAIPAIKELVHAHVLSDFAKSERAWVEALLRHHRRQCRAAGEGAGRELPEQGASGHAGQGFLRPEPDRPRRHSPSIIARDVMGFKCGIVGLPNVGKSTLFNALTETAAAQAANYPFCTIEPNVGEVAVPDPRLDELATLAKSAEIMPTRLTFVDIAGLVRGASKGEGLGNQFLANIREVDAIAHVVRCFEDDDVTHVENRIDPIADIETIETELMLADLDSLERRVDALEKKAKGGDKEAKERARRSTWSSARSRCCATASRRAWSSASPRRRRPSSSSAC